MMFKVWNSAIWMIIYHSSLLIHGRIGSTRQALVLVSQSIWSRTPLASFSLTFTD